MGDSLVFSYVCVCFFDSSGQGLIMILDFLVHSAPNHASSRNATSLFDRCLCGSANRSPGTTNIVTGCLRDGPIDTSINFWKEPALSTNLNGQTAHGGGGRGWSGARAQRTWRFPPFQTRVFAYYHYRDHITARDTRSQELNSDRVCTFDNKNAARECNTDKNRVELRNVNSTLWSCLIRGWKKMCV